jgi:hypothetical protein
VIRIELRRGPSYHDPAETIEYRDHGSEDMNGAIDEARKWLVDTQNNHPEKKATHYRVISPIEILVGGPP